MTSATTPTSAPSHGASVHLPYLRDIFYGVPFLSYHAEAKRIITPIPARPFLYTESMDTDDILKSHDQRIQSLEQTVRKHEGDIAATEDKASSAWHEISEVKDDVGNLYDKVEELDKNVKTVMGKQTDMERDMQVIKNSQTNMTGEIKSLKKWLIIIGAVIAIAGFIMYKNGSDVPEKVVELILPAIQKV